MGGNRNKSRARGTDSRKFPSRRRSRVIGVNLYVGTGLKVVFMRWGSTWTTRDFCNPTMASIDRVIRAAKKKLAEAENAKA